MSSFEEQERTSEKLQKHVPKWKNLLSLKHSSFAIPIEHSSKTGEDGKSKKLKRNQSTDRSFKISGKEKTKDESEDETSKEEKKKKKKNKHKKKRQKVNHEKYEMTNEKINDPKRLSLESKVMDSSILLIEQLKLKIPEEFTHAAKAGLNYLLIWRYYKEEWKFKKIRQIWLLKNAYNEDLLSEDFFKIFLEYIAELSGLSRDATFRMAQDVINNLGFEEQKDDKNDKITDQKDDNEKRNEQVKLIRAKAIVRVLS